MSNEEIDRTASEPQGSKWTGGKVVGLVFASLAAMVGVLLLLAGIGLFVVHGVARDDDGFYTSDKETLSTDTYAITTDRIAIEPGVADDLPEGLLGDLRVRAEGSGGEPVFLGIGPSAGVERYLDGVAKAKFVDFSRGRAELEELPGGAPRTPPGEQRFWVAMSEGEGEQRIDWDPDEGVWTVAVLNADGYRGVDVEADIGAQVDWLIWVALGFTIVGVIVSTAAILLIIHVSRRAERDRVAAASA